MPGIIDKALSEIDGADLRVAPNFFGRAFRYQCAAIEHQDAVGMFEHHVHVVLGEENADRFFPRDLRGEVRLGVLLNRRRGRREERGATLVRRRSCRVRPRLDAAALASPRVRASSLRNTAETWWSTVFSEMTRR